MELSENDIKCKDYGLSCFPDHLNCKWSYNMDNKRKKVYQECKQKLLTLREELINKLKEKRYDLTDKVEGDEGDMAQVFQNQNSSISQRENNLKRLVEIDHALENIENGSYGVCEETEEPIELERLLAIPWTSLSIEGAQIIESQRKRFG